MNIGVLMAFIIIAIVLAISLKSRNPEISAIISVTICISIISLSVDKLKSMLKVLDRISAYIKVDSEYLSILLKLIGIAYICEFASGISKDAGYNAVAAQIELFGKLTMLVVSVPVLMQVIEMILGMM